MTRFTDRKRQFHFYKKIYFFLLILLTLLSIYIFYFLQKKNSLNSPNYITQISKEAQDIVEIKFLHFQTLSKRKDPASIILNSMTLEEKVGQMFIGGGYTDNQINSQIQLCKNSYFGGVILMKYDVANSQTTKNTLSNLNTFSKTSDIPIFIAIDEEGSVISRLKSQMPEQTNQSQILTEKQAISVADKRGAKLKELGINLVFAPVLDYSNNPASFLYSRTFHTNKTQIALLGVSMIKGFKQNNIIASPKHFPGHPDNNQDSHKLVPEVDINSNDFSKYALQFKNSISSGEIEMIMIGHILFPKIDSKISSLSEKIITEKLRNEFKYNGVIITDDMNMGAITKNYQTGEAAILAVQAGNDILLYVTNPNVQEDSYQAVLGAVRNKQIAEDRIDQSVYRILKLKLKYLI